MNNTNNFFDIIAEFSFVKIVEIIAVLIYNIRINR